MVLMEETMRQLYQGVNENGQPQLIRMAQARPARAGTSNGTSPSATALSTGRWTNAEHDRFLDAMDTHRSGPWQLIADHVGARTARQVMTHAQKYRQKIVRRAARRMEQKSSASSPLSGFTSSESAAGSSSPSASDELSVTIADVEMEQTGGVLTGETSRLLPINATHTFHTQDAGANFSEGAHSNPPPTGQLQLEQLSGTDRYVDVEPIVFAPASEGVVLDSSIWDEFCASPFEIPVQLINFQQTEAKTDVQPYSNAPSSDQLLPEQFPAQLHMTGGSETDTLNLSSDDLVDGEMSAFARPFGGSSFETDTSVTTGEVSGEHRVVVGESTGPADEPPLGRNWPPDTSSFNSALDNQVADWTVNSETLADLHPDTVGGDNDLSILDHDLVLLFEVTSRYF